MANAHYQLREASIDECLALRQHFANLAEVTLWGGEGYLWPLTKHQFLQKLMLQNTQSFIFCQNQQAVGFGQICDRFGRHHLARLLIFPKYRQQGLAAILMQALLLQANFFNKRLDFSLYVFKHNDIAQRAYRKLGFTEAEQPENPRDDLLFMTLNQVVATAYLEQHTAQCHRESAGLRFQITP